MGLLGGLFFFFIVWKIWSFLGKRLKNQRKAIVFPYLRKTIILPVGFNDADLQNDVVRCRLIWQYRNEILQEISSFDAWVNGVNQIIKKSLFPLNKQEKVNKILDFEHYFQVFYIKDGVVLYQESFSLDDVVYLLNTYEFEKKRIYVSVDSASFVISDVLEDFITPEVFQVCKSYYTSMCLLFENYKQEIRKYDSRLTTYKLAQLNSIADKLDMFMFSFVHMDSSGCINQCFQNWLCDMDVISEIYNPFCRRCKKIRIDVNCWYNNDYSDSILQCVRQYGFRYFEDYYVKIEQEYQQKIRTITDESLKEKLYRRWKQNMFWFCFYVDDTLIYVDKYNLEDLYNVGSLFTYPYKIIEIDIYRRSNVDYINEVEKYLLKYGLDEFEQYVKGMEHWYIEQKNRALNSYVSNLRLEQLYKICDDDHMFEFRFVRHERLDGSYKCNIRHLRWFYRHLKKLGLEKTRREYFIKEQRRLMSRALRKQIMERDNYTCQICGKYMPDEVDIEIDHILPVSKGGLTEPNNLQVLCGDCNRHKGAKILPYVQVYNQKRNTR